LPLKKFEPLTFHTTKKSRDVFGHGKIFLWRVEFIS